jgi:hypothetical protein
MGFCSPLGLNMLFFFFSFLLCPGYAVHCGGICLLFYLLLKSLLTEVGIVASIETYSRMLVCTISTGQKDRPVVNQ